MGMANLAGYHKLAGEESGRLAMRQSKLLHYPRNF